MPQREFLYLEPELKAHKTAVTWPNGSRRAPLSPNLHSPLMIVDKSSQPSLDVDMFVTALMEMDDSSQSLVVVDSLTAYVEDTNTKY